jgi:hypothetical protein
MDDITTLININNQIESKFIDEDRQKYIKQNLIPEIYRELNLNDRTLLTEGLILILNFIYLKFNLSDDQIFWNQLTQNENQDLRAFLNMLLPYIREDENDAKKHKLRNLEDIYLSHKKNDLNPEYTYSTAQFNRVKIVDHKTELIPYRHQYFVQNCLLLLSSIETCSHKLYNNFVDVVPLINHKQNNLFTQTVKKLEDPSYPLINGYLDPRPGLPLSDLYNVISNCFYEQVKQNKWLIYDLVDSDGNIVGVLSYLEKIFDLKPLWDQIPFKKLSNQNLFRANLNDFLSPNTKQGYDVLNYFYYFFQKYYAEADELERKGLLKRIDFNTENEEDPDEDEFNQLRPKSSKSLERVPVEHIYQFMLTQFHQFKRTWYYYQLYILKQPYFTNFTLTKSNQKYNVTYKNVFNYAKSMVHLYSEDAIPIRFAKLWTGLVPEFIDQFQFRIRDQQELRLNNPQTLWFNISNNLKRLYPKEPEKRILDINFYVKKSIQLNLADIIFETLIYQGLLSQFVPNSSISNQRVYEITRSSNEKINNDYQAYYYLTGEPYTKDFLLSLKSSNWQLTYALNWVSQINFYHHYINCRVMFITGATGVGKSTQVPKLLMYSLQMINYNLNGSVVCTEPRIPPTIGNATEISQQLGVPIRTEDKTYKRPIDTSNYYVQYKYAEGQHTSQDKAKLLLTTDGTLLVQLKKEPFMCFSQKDQNGITEFYAGNIYDVLIVDEVHEANTNMSLILTLVRDAIHINNSLKLVLISATMEDDESIYRRYYRMINDNRAYPLNLYIVENKLDRINIDRRIHISPPGKTTRFPVYAYYLSEAESKEVTPENYRERGVAKTLEVVRQHPQGDVLLFVATTFDIDQSQNELNRETPRDTLCVGFHGQMTEEEKDFVINIDKRLKTYTRYKEDINLPENEVSRRVPIGTYKRAIIIATNVAEASLTLASIKYVIDTGYVNAVIYDPLTEQSVAKRLPVSHTSSVQRMGRVGRVSAGYFYALYSQEKVALIKTSYQIANTDISSSILDLLKKDINDPPIINSQNDINNPSVMEQFSQLIRNNEDSEKFISYNHLINDQYIYYDSKGKVLYKYHGNEEGESYYPFKSRALSGYDSDQLQDNTGQFYIIHPDENIVDREPYSGRFISLKNSSSVDDQYYYFALLLNDIDVEESEEKAYRQMRDKFKQDSAILPKVFLILNDAVRLSLVIQIQNEYITSNVSSIMSQLKLEYNLDLFKSSNSFLWYLYGVANSLDEDILGLICMANEVTNSGNLFKGKIPFDAEGDIHYLWSLWKTFKRIMNQFQLTQINLLNLKNNYQRLFKDYERKNSSQLLSYDQYSILNSLDKSNRFDFEDYLKTVKPQNLIEKKNVERVIDLIQKTVGPQGVTNQFVENVVNCYLKSIYTLNLKQYSDNADITDNLKWVKEHLNFKSASQNPDQAWAAIRDAYIRAYSNNLIYNAHTHTHTVYINITTGMIYNPNLIFRTQQELSTLALKTRYLIYYSTPMTPKGSVTLLTPVNINTVFSANPIFYYQLLYNQKFNRIKQKLYAHQEQRLIFNELQLQELRRYYNKEHLLEYIDRIGDLQLKQEFQ